MTATAGVVLSDAWDEFRTTVDDLKAQLESTARFQDSPEDRAKAYHALMEGQAMAYNWAVAPRMLHPRLYRNLTWQSDVYTLGTNCQDFLYYVTFLDGRQRYRLHGRTGDLCLSMVQVFDGVWGEPGFKTVANHSLADFTIDDDGRFSIELGPDPQEGNWIALDPESTFQMVLVRWVLPDWSSDRGELDIERVSVLPDDFYDEDEFSEEAVAVRIRRATAVLRHLVGTFSELYDNSLKMAAGQKNVLGFFPGEAIGVGGSPVSNYAMGVFEIADDEALLIEMDEPDGRYWSFQLGDVWTRSLNFSSRQNTLNMSQTTVDDDGKVRMVISVDDPGIANWLDACGHRSGVFVLRNYLASADPQIDTRVVKLAELDSALPAGTHRVTPVERQAAVRHRRVGMAGRLGE